jgi:hypothetical protein
MACPFLWIKIHSKLLCPKCYKEARSSAFDQQGDALLLNRF